MEDFMQRIIRAMKLDIHLYEEVEADQGAMGQAMGVVILSSIAAGIGAIGQAGSTGILLGTLSALVGWFVWSYLTFLIGTKMLPEPQTQSDLGEMLRTIGFASAPGLVRILGIIPGLMGLVFLASGIWMLIAVVIAVRQALDYQSTARAVGVCLIGWIAQALIMAVVFMIFG